MAAGYTKGARMTDTNTGWRKRQIALDIKAENARELGLDYEPNKTIMEMAQETMYRMNTVDDSAEYWTATDKELEAFAKLVREDALVQQAPVQEPVAWMEMVVANLVREGVNKHNARELAEHFYTASPAAQRPWVGLTDEEMKDALTSVDAETKRLPPGFKDFARAIETKLRSKNEH
jgi:hypothetical protein